MDTTDPEIVFDDSGVCNHCKSFFLNKPQKDGRLFDTTVERIKKDGRGKKYDVIIGVSGGVDSSFLAILMKEKGLRPLLVHMDNGWNSEEANLNILQLVKHLGVDYESYVLDWQEFRSIQVAFLKASIVEAETPTDIAIAGVLHRIAAKHGVKWIVGGSNYASEGILPHLWHYDSRDMKLFDHITKRFGGFTTRKFPKFGYTLEAYYKLVKGIRMFYPLNLIDYDKNEVKKSLINNYGWKDYGGKHHESRYTKFIQSYLLPKKFALDYRKATYSSMICAGLMNRDEALALLKTSPYNLDNLDADLQYASKKLAIEKDELWKIIDAPAKSYRDYPNNEVLLGRIYDTYKRFFSKKVAAPEM